MYGAIEELTRQLVWSACTCQARSTALSTVCLQDRKRHFALGCRLESLGLQESLIQGDLAR